MSKIIDLTKEEMAALQPYVDRVNVIRGLVDDLMKPLYDAKEDLWKIVYKMWPGATNLHHPAHSQWQIAVGNTVEDTPERAEDAPDSTI